MFQRPPPPYWEAPPSRGWHVASTYRQIHTKPTQIDTKYPIFESTSLGHDIQKFHKYHQCRRTNPAEALKKE